MGLVDDLNRLSDLHASGQLSDAEFDEAKTRLIRDSTGTHGSDGDTAGGMATSVVAPPGPTPTSAPPGAGVGSGVIAGTYGARPVTGATTVVTSGLGTGSVTLGGMTPVTRLRNRAQGLAAPASVEPERSATGTFVRSLLLLLVPILFVAVMVASAGVAVFPGLARLSAPFLCKAPYDHSYVDITSSNPVPGETYIEWELQCYNDRGTVEAADDFSVMGIVFLEAVATLFALTVVAVVLFRIRRRRRRRRAQSQGSGSPSAGDLSDMSGGPIVNPVP